MANRAARATWHLLQVSGPLDLEFASALAERVPLIAWEPRRTLLPVFRPPPAPVRLLQDPPLEVRSFALLRGFSRFPFSLLARVGTTLTAQLLEATPEPESSPLICTAPYFAEVAERWPGPVLYWLTDRIEQYDGADRAAVHRLDTRLCRASTVVLPNSVRLAEYLHAVAGCPPEKLHVLPNATRARNLLTTPPAGPAPLPADIADLPRPIAGVLGNMAGNINWLLLEELIARVPWLHWAFVGPTDAPIQDRLLSAARDRLRSHPLLRFVGAKPYGELVRYARAIDVAILPYLRREPTYSGSSTRFYEHLAACRPMLSTRGFEELLRKEPLLQLIDTAEDAATKLTELRALGFEDGFVDLRWRESRKGTWQARAAATVEHLDAALGQDSSALLPVRAS